MPDAGVEALLDQLLPRIRASAGRGCVIGIGGSVAVGKTTVAEALARTLRAVSSIDGVEIVSTDGFLHPNATLDELGLSMQKGTPDSHDTAALISFVRALRAATGSVAAPVYSHETYDVVPGEHHEVPPSDVVLLEGLHVLQTPGADGLVVSDHLDVAVYLDAAETDLERWFVDRFMAQRAEAVDRRRSFFHQFVELDDATAESIAHWTWTEINLPTLTEYVLPRRADADLVVETASDHSIRSVYAPPR